MASVGVWVWVWDMHACMGGCGCHPWYHWRTHSSFMIDSMLGLPPIAAAISAGRLETAGTAWSSNTRVTARCPRYAASESAEHRSPKGKEGERRRKKAKEGERRGKRKEATKGKRKPVCMCVCGCHFVAPHQPSVPTWYSHACLVLAPSVPTSGRQIWSPDRAGMPAGRTRRPEGAVPKPDRMPRSGVRVSAHPRPPLRTPAWYSPCMIGTHAYLRR